MQTDAHGPRYRIIHAPSVLGLKPTGVETLGQRLVEREHLDARLGAPVVERLTPPAYSSIRDAETLTLNAHAIAEWTPLLADAVAAVMGANGFPVVLGGDCSIILGAMLALRRKGRYGLLFIDGHADFYQPEAEPNGEAASMDLALVSGHGPELLTNIEGRGPLVRASDAVAFGFRDGEQQVENGSQPLPSELLAIDLLSVREFGVDQAARRALAHLCRDELDGFFIHLDADCLDDAVMPAVDYRIPGGLRPEELSVVLRAALSTGRAVGIEVTIYNPKLDPDGRAGHILADAIVQGLGEAAPVVAQAQ